MKIKSTLSAILLAAAMSGVAAPAFAATNDSKYYDFRGFNDENLMKLFYQAKQAGRKYPTAAEFAAAGIQPADIAFIRSHVRNKGILDRSDRLVKDTYEKRDLWMNIPMDAGKASDVGQPNMTFHSDVFSMWNYTNIFGSWNHGVFSAPSAWTDAAHRNGTDIYSGIKFFDTTGGRGQGASAWMNFITETNADGTFKYAEPMINLLMYFGFDGINYNWEDSGYTDEDVIEFHRELHRLAKKYGFDNFHTGIYTPSSGLNRSETQALFGDKNGRTHDLMLNYSGGDFSYSLKSSAQQAIAAMGTTEGLYTGMWFVGLDRGWTRLNADEYSKQVSICLWGEHAQSRIWSYNKGADSYEAQANYQLLMERLMSGGNRNPLARPAISNTGNNWEQNGDKKPLQTFAGLASWIPERSAIKGNLPFETHFNLGNGDRYAYKGKKTAGAWYNMSAQDYVPTYRWLVVKPGTQTASTDVDASFTHLDQYIGGTSLLLQGKATSTGTDIVLYKTDLNVSAGNVFAKVAVKNGKEGNNPSNLYVILQKANGTWVEAPVGTVNGKTWQEKTVNISGIAKSDVIKRIGLRVKGNDNNYKLYVGELQINDGVKATPANVKNVNVDVKEETKLSLCAKVYWDVDAKASKRASWDLLYNDEANIDHFEVLYKNGEAGTISEIARTSSWGAFIGDIMFSGADDKPYIGVRSVSTDLKTYSPIQWVAVKRNSNAPNYVDNSYGISQMDPNCDGADIARKQRYVTSVTTTGATQNLNYKATGPVADGSQYADATSNVLKVKQGQKITLNIKCYNTLNLSPSDGLRYCFAGGWIDLDGDHVFNPDDIATNPKSGERLFKVGKDRAATQEFETTGVDAVFTVPTDAKTGKSRLRIVFSDAWFAGAFLPTGLHNKGFSIDFGVEITGNNPERQGPADIHDQGVAEQPEGLTPSAINNVAEGGAGSLNVEDGQLNFENVDKAWIYDATGATVKYLVAPTTFATTSLAKGIYVVKMQQGAVLRTQKVVIK